MKVSPAKFEGIVIEATNTMEKKSSANVKQFDVPRVYRLQILYEVKRSHVEVERSHVDALHGHLEACRTGSSGPEVHLPNESTFCKSWM